MTLFCKSSLEEVLLCFLLFDFDGEGTAVFFGDFGGNVFTLFLFLSIDSLSSLSFSPPSIFSFVPSEGLGCILLLLPLLLLLLLPLLLLLFIVCRCPLTERPRSACRISIERNYGECKKSFVFDFRHLKKSSFQLDSIRCYNPLLLRRLYLMCQKQVEQMS